MLSIFGVDDLFILIILERYLVLLKKIIMEKQKIYEFIDLFVKHRNGWGISSQGAHLRNDLGLTSMDVVELLVDLEKEFSIHINDELVEKWETVDDVIDTVYDLVD